MKIIGQLADLLIGVDEEVLPALMTTLEPLLTLLMNQQVDNIDLPTVLSYAAQTLQKSKVEVSLSSTLGDLDFLQLGKEIEFDPLVYLILHTFTNHVFLLLHELRNVHILRTF